MELINTIASEERSQGVDCGLAWRDVQGGSGQRICILDGHGYSCLPGPYVFSLCKCHQEHRPRGQTGRLPCMFKTKRECYTLSHLIIKSIILY